MSKKKSSNAVVEIKTPRGALVELLDSLGESTLFCTSGKRDIILPGLVVEGVGEIGFPIPPDTAKRLTQIASQAPYGRGEETIVDTNVRRVWQIEPGLLSFRNPTWQTFLGDIIKEVGHDFGINSPIHGELYKLLVYEPGGFFKPHRDTEKLKGMFATLVIGLPSEHQGGELLVTHDQQTVAVDFGGSPGKYAIQFAAFYADCQHEIKPLQEGYRVCLVYNLALTRTKEQPQAPSYYAEITESARLLREIFQDEELNKIAIPFKHQYSEEGLHPDALKGSDRSTLAVLAQAAQKANCQLHVALMTCHRWGSADESTLNRRWGRRYYDDYEEDDDDNDVDDSVEFYEVDEQDIVLKHWFNDQGESLALGEMNLEKEEFIVDIDFDDFAKEQKIHEATGNEGVTLERWYRQAVAVLWPQSHAFRVLAADGPHVGVPALADFVKSQSHPADHKDCIAFATAVMDCWPKHHYFHYKHLETATIMLEQLGLIQDSSLADRFIREILAFVVSGTEGSALRQLCEVVGWKTLAPALHILFSAPSEDGHSKTVTPHAEVFAELCQATKHAKPEQREVCQELALTLFQTIAQYDTSLSQRNRWDKPKPPTDLFASFFGVIHLMTNSELPQQFLTHVFSLPKHYDLHSVLLPTVKQLLPTIKKLKKPSPAYMTLLNHCVDTLDTLTRVPVSAPTDWKQDTRLKCQCKHCQSLQEFLQDPVQRIFRFSKPEADRKHLESEIASHHCDLDLHTEKKGRPYTLICTKNRNSYEEKCRRFTENTELLAEFRKMQANIER